ncbi:YqjK-like family protein [Martelella alba]|uniref:Cell division protein FtsH n=1 Tax=Martelella alba TaxID=2590451 RepID=A0ABY2SP60_9HYPH|nr:YqjK-like family protein [Martelella alba]TKI06936.1 cell division protein FtsH [Martelella alba]
MPHHRQRKAMLIARIHRQRQEMSAAKDQWLHATSRFDRGWVRVLHWRKYLVVGSSLLALYNIRHPSRMVRWTKRLISVIGTLKLLRSTFQLR